MSTDPAGKPVGGGGTRWGLLVSCSAALTVFGPPLWIVFVRLTNLGDARDGVLGLGWVGLLPVAVFLPLGVIVTMILLMIRSAHRSRNQVVSYPEKPKR